VLQKRRLLALSGRVGLALVAAGALLAGLAGAGGRATFPVRPADFSLASWVFLRWLGAVYLIAFCSLAVQARGLIGQNGIVPVAPVLNSLRDSLGKARFLRLPTLFWLRCTDRAICLFCLAGIALALLVMLDIATGPALVCLWALYLSFDLVCDPFLSFQWDALLLETGFLAIFLEQWKITPGLPDTAPSASVLMLFWLLLFRLMFMSGAVKILSEDPAWSRWLAMTFHYETQPLPTPVAYYAHRLPLWFHRLSVPAVFFIELVVPLFLFGPRPAAEAAALILIGFQALIMLTGNYTFFNLLTIGLCLPVLSNQTLAALLPARISAPLLQSVPHQPANELWFLPLAASLGLLNVVPLLRLVTRRLPRWLSRFYESTRPFQLVNSYGLFAVMTTTRPEIIVEGSDDLETWLPYEFKYKPGDTSRPLPWVAPHQPRLDWQMWFAALATADQNPWFLNFVWRLLKGSPEVLALLARNPFPQAPPRYIRALLYDYVFTSPAQRRKTGEVWQRELIGIYLPPVSA